MLNSIPFYWSQIINTWESKLELMHLYKSISSNTSVPSRYRTKEGVMLDKWVDIQRIYQNLLSTTQISMLDYISFD